MKRPKCGAIVYKSRGGDQICPNCGFGSPTATAMQEEKQERFEEFKRSILEILCGEIDWDLHNVKWA